MQNIEIIGVVGAGAMGRGIAQVGVTGGMAVRLFDAAPGAARYLTAVAFEYIERAASYGTEAEHADSDRG